MHITFCVYFCKNTYGVTMFVINTTARYLFKSNNWLLLNIYKKKTIDDTMRRVIQNFPASENLNADITHFA